MKRFEEIGRVNGKKVSLCTELSDFNRVVSVSLVRDGVTVLTISGMYSGDSDLLLRLSREFLEELSARIMSGWRPVPDSITPGEPENGK